MCDACSKGDQEHAEVLICTAEVDGKPMASVGAVCGIPVVTQEYGEQIESELRLEAGSAVEEEQRRVGRVLWAQV